MREVVVPRAQSQCLTLTLAQDCICVNCGAPRFFINWAIRNPLQLFTSYKLRVTAEASLVLNTASRASFEWLRSHTIPQSARLRQANSVLNRRAAKMVELASMLQTGITLLAGTLVSIRAIWAYLQNFFFFKLLAVQPPERYGLGYEHTKAL